VAGIVGIDRIDGESGAAGRRHRGLLVRPELQPAEAGDVDLVHRRREEAVGVHHRRVIGVDGLPGRCPVTCRVGQRHGGVAAGERLGEASEKRAPLDSRVDGAIGAGGDDGGGEIAGLAGRNIADDDRAPGSAR
jgi:hypothetical protein